MRELRSLRSVERLAFVPRTADELLLRELDELSRRKVSCGELTAGCLACREAEEFRVPIILPIRERRLVLDWLVTFETDDLFESHPDARLSGSGFRELFDWLFNPRLLLAGVEVLLDVLSLFRFELLSTGRLTVGLMMPPMRDVMLELILLFELLVERFIVLREESRRLRLVMLLRLD